MSNNIIKNPIPDHIFDILACPICKSDLRYSKDKKNLVCVKCATKYPIKDKIPIPRINIVNRVYLCPFVSTLTIFFIDEKVVKTMNKPTRIPRKIQESGPILSQMLLPDSLESPMYGKIFALP